MIGSFGWGQNKEYENNMLNEYKGIEKSSLISGRIMIYVCPECGDIGCGAITANINVTNTEVIWNNFAYEDDNAEPNITDYQGIGPFIFNKKQYLEIIEQLKIEILK